MAHVGLPLCQEVSESTPCSTPRSISSHPRLAADWRAAALAVCPCACLRYRDAPQLREFEAALSAASGMLTAARPGVSSAELQAQGLVDGSGRLIFHGGMEDLGRFHLSIVRGDAWHEARGGASWSASGDWIDAHANDLAAYPSAFRPRGAALLRKKKLRAGKVPML